jgi:hypothetical protein
MSRLDEARERLDRFRAVTLPHNGLSAHPLEDDVALLLRSEADLRAALTQSAEKVARLERTVERMNDAFAWALGERDHFAMRGDKQGAYWWRTELRRRRDAALAASSPDHAGAPEGE